MYSRHNAQQSIQNTHHWTSIMGVDMGFRPVPATYLWANWLIPPANCRVCADRVRSLARLHSQSCRYQYSSHLEYISRPPLNNPLDLVFTTLILISTSPFLRETLSKRLLTAPKHHMKYVLRQECSRSVLTRYLACWYYQPATCRPSRR